jgi:hypothetical protein
MSAEREIEEGIKRRSRQKAKKREEGKKKRTEDRNEKIERRRVGK